jgi:hypothetical protein
MYKILSILLSIFILSTAYAETLVGPYLGAGIGYGFVSHGTTHVSTDNFSVAYNFVVGYNVNEYVAADVGFALLPHEIYIRQDQYTGQVSTNSLADMAIRISIPFSDFAYPYLHIGVGAVIGNKYIPSGDEFGLFTGLGVKFKASHAIGITVEDYGILIPSAVLQDMNILSIGLVYEF